jgi:acyl carrier protein
MSTAVTREQVEARVLEAIESFGPEGDVTPDASFEGLDVDSLDLVELAQISEEEFGVKLESEDMKELTTVGDAIDLITERARS